MHVRHKLAIKKKNTKSCPKPQTHAGDAQQEPLALPGWAHRGKKEIKPKAAAMPVNSTTLFSIGKAYLEKKTL